MVIRTVYILLVMLCIQTVAMAQDSIWYQIPWLFGPTTMQQESALQDSLIHRYAEYKKIMNGSLEGKELHPTPPSKKSDKEEFDLTYRYNYDFYTTLMYQKSFNTDPYDDSEKDNLTAYYNITLNTRVNIKKVSWTSYFFNEFGYRQFIDSIGGKQDDMFYFKNNINYDIIKYKLTLTFMTNVKSQFWPSYNYRFNDDTGLEEKFLFTDYNSPGYFLFSGGLKYEFNDDGANVEMGLAGGKITRIRNQDLFEIREQDELYSVEKGQKRNIDFGINIQLNMPPTKLSKHIIMENYTQVYLPNQSLAEFKTYTLDVNNAVHVMFLKYMRLSLRTKLAYDIDIYEKVKVVNQLSVGFYLTNRID